MVDRITAAADGNPLYVEELVAMLVDDGVVTQDADGGWVATRSLDEVRVPPSISALLAARLDHLVPTERDVAQRASVIGRVFEGAAVSELSPDGARDGVRPALLGLIRKELIRRERTDEPLEIYKFRHLLLRDAAYEALPKAERAAPPPPLRRLAGSDRRRPPHRARGAGRLPPRTGAPLWRGTG